MKVYEHTYSFASEKDALSFAELLRAGEVPYAYLPDCTPFVKQGEVRQRVKRSIEGHLVDTRSFVNVEGITLIFRTPYALRDTRAVYLAGLCHALAFTSNILLSKGESYG